MNINHISAQNNPHKHSFGAQYSERLIIPMNNLVNRVFKINARRNLKLKGLMQDISNCQKELAEETSLLKLAEIKDALFEKVKKFKLVAPNMSKYKAALRYNLDRIDRAYPEGTIYPYVTKNNEAYFAVDTLLGRKLLARIKVKNGQNPIESPESIKMNISDLKNIGDSLEKLDNNTKWFRFLKNLLKFKLF